ncbi:hypothetical protein GJAV_G00273800 [Gymnothorax javanicus]|nr:hypothetical protein GJAV_G00273800 [Gymnothorax javanicus]
MKAQGCPLEFIGTSPTNSPGRDERGNPGRAKDRFEQRNATKTDTRNDSGSPFGPPSSSEERSRSRKKV